MTLSQTIVRLASVLAGVAIVVTLGWTLFAVGDCSANVGNAVDWCGLGWIAGGLICAAIGLAWLAVVVAAAVVGWVDGRLNG